MDNLDAALEQMARKELGNIRDLIEQMEKRLQQDGR